MAFEVGSAEAEADALDDVVAPGERGFAFSQAGGPIGTTLFLFVGLTAESVNCEWSKSTERYADVRNARPSSGMSFLLTSCKLLMSTSRVVLPFVSDMIPWGL